MWTLINAIGSLILMVSGYSLVMFKIFPQDVDFFPDFEVTYRNTLLICGVPMVFGTVLLSLMLFLPTLKNQRKGQDNAFENWALKTF